MNAIEVVGVADPRWNMGDGHKQQFYATLCELSEEEAQMFIAGTVMAICETLWIARQDGMTLDDVKEQWRALGDAHFGKLAAEELGAEGGEN